jgi:hypothetical protein
MVTLLHRCRLCAAWQAAGLAVILLAAPQASAQLLNPGFETDALMDQEPLPFVTDWQIFGGGEKYTASAPTHPVRTGVGSLQLVGLGGFGVPLALQTFPAEPGQVWDLQAYIRVEEALTAGTRALVKIVFRDLDLAVDLQPAAVNIGVPDPDGNFPGVIPDPQVTSATTLGEWHLSRAQGVAPAETDQVSLFALLVDETPGTVYFDDFQAGLVEATQPGDFDGDGDVDNDDLDDWRAAFALTDVGDADDDGDSDGNDFLIWQQNVGAGGSPIRAVPEPATLGGALTVVALLAAYRRRRIG